MWDSGIRRQTETAVSDRTFEAIVFDWDGTAVPDRSADAGPVRERVEALCRAGMDVFVVSGTHVGNIDGQLGARPAGPGCLFLCLNRGSEVFRVDQSGPRLVWRRASLPEEDAALDRAAALVVERLAARGVHAEIVSQRLNRRKIDLIPEPAWADPPKARIDELLRAVMTRLDARGFTGLAEVVSLARDAALDAGLLDPRVTSDVKHVEIGLTDKSDSAAWALDHLAARGIGSSLVLIAGDEFASIGGAAGSDSLMLIDGASRAAVVSVGVEPEGVPARITHLAGGPKAFVACLDEQLERRSAGRVPSIDEDPAWTLVVEDRDVQHQRVHEALLTLADGHFGVRGAREEDGEGTEPLLVAAGTYESRDDTTTLLHGPLWTGLTLAESCEHIDRRTLDLRTGVLLRECRDGTEPLRTLRFASIARSGIMAMRAEGPASDLASGPSLLRPARDGPYEAHAQSGVEYAQTCSDLGGGITAAASTHEHVAPGLRVIERTAAFVGSSSLRPSFGDALELLQDARHEGFEKLLAEQRACWSARWDDASVSIEGDPELELAARFAIFHLLASVSGKDEAALGARGLSGFAYGGHVFWDSDVFVLPMLAATHPAAARAMLEYRIRRLPAARDAAARRQLNGARFPWESASDGRDVTISSVRTPEGIVPIRTGEHEEHITADVAWAAWMYATWTGDDAFLDGPGRDLITETARYWASRAGFRDDGRAHIDGVIGPDEYHEIVDDNAYTNVMARWNLRRAADLSERRGATDESRTWRRTAAALVDGWDPETNRYEQFHGFSKLEPLVIAEVAQRPVAADVLLGRDRVAGAQVIKQADVLMLHHLVPDEVAAGSLEPNLDFYEPRTAHGSSLSPAIHAALLARAGRTEAALQLLRIASRIDLDDLTGTTAGGLHMAAFGGVWQALAFGFAGLRLHGDLLGVDPKLPAAWKALELRMRVRGRRAGIRVSNDEISIRTDGPLAILLPGGTRSKVSAPEARFSRFGEQWRERT